MDDNKNQNQSNQAATDYQKILDEYAASVKPEDVVSTNEPQKPEVDLNITTSLKEAPVKTEENKIPEIKSDITEDIPNKSTETYLKGINSPQIESPIHPSLAANLEVDEPTPTLTNKIPVEITPEPTKTTTEASPDLKTPDLTPERSPEEIKKEIDKLLEDDTTSQTASESFTPKKSSSGRVFFIFALILFLAVAAGLAYFLFLSPPSSSKTKSSDDSSNNSVTPTTVPSDTSGVCELNDKTYQVGESFPSADGCNTCSCSSAGVIACTEKACIGTPTVIPATKSATTTSTTKTAFQKMITNLSLYKDISKEERELRFSNTTSASVFWPSWVKNTDKLYSFAQNLNKGSIKGLFIDNKNLSSIVKWIDGAGYQFYLTPNYEKWTNEEFKNLDYEATGIGDIAPLYAYSDKLIWTTAGNCGGRTGEPGAERDWQVQCDSLVKEIKTAFP